jgi:EipB-like
MRFSLLFILLTSSALAQNTLLPHKAVYALELDTSKPHEGLDGASGKMVIEFTGNKCEGFVTTTRTLLNMDHSGRDVVSDQRATNFESGDGSVFQFSTKHLMDNEVVENFTGKAERKNGVVTVRYTTPEKVEYILDEPALFPNQHSFEMFKVMKESGKLLNAPIFDGSQLKGTYYSTLTIFNKPLTTPPVEKAANHAALKGERTPVFITFTNSDKKEADAAVSFSMRYDFHVNGVATNMTIINPALTLKATLSAFETLPETKCDLK